MVWSQYFIKILGLHFGNSVLDNSDWDKISHSLTKKIFQNQYFEQSPTLFGMKKRKTKIVNQILLPKISQRLDIYYFKIYQRGN